MNQLTILQYLMDEQPDMMWVRVVSVSAYFCNVVGAGRRTYQFLRRANRNQFMRRRNQIEFFVRFKADIILNCLPYDLCV